MSANKSDIEYQWKLQSSLLDGAVQSRFLKPTGRNNTFKKSDYIRALSVLMTYKRHGHELTRDLSPRDIWNALTPNERFRLSFYSPCLARPIDDLRAAEQRDIFTNPDWVFTEKHRGTRAVIVMNNRLTNLYSRHYTDNCCLVDYWGHIDRHADFNGTFAADVELKITDGIDITDDLTRLGFPVQTRAEQIDALLRLEPNTAVAVQHNVAERFGVPLVDFVLIAPLYFDGTDYRNKTLGEGMDVYDSVITFSNTIGLPLKPLRRCGQADEYSKRIFLQSVLENGSDGVVAQNRNGMYVTADTRSKTSYIKIKRLNTERMSDTLDAFVTGVYPNGRIRVSIYEQSGGKQTKRNIAFVNAPKTPSVFIGTVVELSGDGLDAQRNLIKPRAVRIRQDKQQFECVYTSEFLDAQTIM